MKLFLILGLLLTMVSGPLGTGARSAADRAAAPASVAAAQGAGTPSEPLSKGHNLVPWDQIAVAWRNSSGPKLKVYNQGRDANGALSGAPTQVGARAFLPINEQNVGGWASDMATGDFNGDGRDDIVAYGYDQSANAPKLVVSESGGAPDPNGSTIRSTSKPALAALSPTSIHMFVRGSDNAIWHAAGLLGAWGGWESLGGNVSSGPAAVVAGGLIHLFARGANNTLVHRFFSPGDGWSSWESLGGTLTSEPAAVARGDGSLDVFARGADNQLVHVHGQGPGPWSSWEALGGVLTSGPSAAFSTAGGQRIDVVARGADNGVIHLRGIDDLWASWESLPGAGTETSDPAVAALPAPSGALVVYTRSQYGRLAYRAYDPGSNTWTGWLSLGWQTSSGPGTVAFVDQDGRRAGYVAWRGIHGELSAVKLGYGSFPTGPSLMGGDSLGSLPACCDVLTTDDQLDGTLGEYRVTTGFVRGTGHAEIATAHLGRQDLTVGLYDTTGSLTPARESSVRVPLAAPAPGERYMGLSLATGNFVGRGNRQLIAVWTLTSPTLSRVYWEIFTVDALGNLTAAVAGPLYYDQFTPGASGGYTDIAVGDFDNNGKDEVALVNSGLNTVLESYRVGADFHTITQVGFVPLSARNGSRNVIAAGDFSGTKQLQIAVGTESFQPGTADNSAYNVRVQLYQADAGLQLSAVPGKAISAGPVLASTAARPGAMVMKAGDLNRDTVDELVFAFEGVFHVAGIQVYEAKDAGAPVQESSISVAEPIGDSSWMLALGLGDFAGHGLRVGPPTERIVPQVGQILAVINAPPRHCDAVDGVQITAGCGASDQSYAGYATDSSTTSQMTLKVENSWDLSAKLKTTIGDEEGSHVSASIGFSYGQHFEKTTTNATTMSFGQDIKAITDDRIIYTSTDYRVWEYPVYNDDSDTPAGNISVVFPIPNSTALTVSDGSECRSFYRPTHQVNNIFSYPPTADQLTGYTSDLVGTNPKLTVSSGGDAQDWVKWGQQSGNEQSRESALGLNVGLEAKVGGDKIPIPFVGEVATPFSVEFSADGNYDSKQMSTQTDEAETSTAVTVFFGQLAPEENGASYQVQPHIYWSQSGYLVLDYTTTTSNARTWDTYYNKPDPAFNLPWKDNNRCVDAQRLQTKEITFDPARPRNGQSVTVSALVHNYSPTGTGQTFTVRFYKGDPAAGGVQIGDDQQIANLRPRETRTVSTAMVASGDGPQPIYAVIDPNTRLNEVHRDNDKAYAVLNVAAETVLDPGAQDATVVDVGVASSSLQSLDYADSRGNSTSVLVPAGATDQVTSLTYAPLPAGSQPPISAANASARPAVIPSSFWVPGTEFGLQARGGSNVSSSYFFAKPAVTVVHYDPAQLGGVDPARLEVRYWNGSAWVDASCGAYERHPEASWLAVTTCRTGAFALGIPTHVGDFRVLIPLLRR